MASTLQRRATPRAEIACDVTLSRARAGAPVIGRTCDLGPGGMRVATRRPLHVDEQLEFVLALADGTSVAGRAHVIRHHASDVYALLFDRLSDADRTRLASIAAAPPPTLH